MAQNKDKQTIFLASGQIAALLLSFATPLVLTRILSPADYGTYLQFVMICLFLQPLFGLNIQSSLLFFIPRTPPQQHRAIIGNSFAVLLIGALLACLLLNISACSSILLGKSELQKYLTLLCLCIFCGAPAIAIEPLYIVFENNILSLWYPVISNMIRVFAVVAGVCWSGNLVGVLNGLLVVNFLLGGACVFYAWLHLRKYSHTHWFSWKMLERQIRYIVPFGMAMLLSSIAFKADKLIMINLLSAEKYALYAVSLWGIPGIQQVVSALANVYLVSLNKAFFVKDRQKILTEFHELSTKIFSVTFPICLLGFFYAREIISVVFSEKYLEVVPLFRIFIFCTVFLISGVSIVIRASGKTKYTFWAHFFGTVLTVPLVFLFVKKYGVAGGVVGAVFAQFIPEMFLAFSAARVIETRILRIFPWKNILIIIAITLLMLMPLWLTYRFGTGNIFVHIIASGIFIAIVFLLEMILGVALIDVSTAIDIAEKYRLERLSIFLLKIKERKLW